MGYRVIVIRSRAKLDYKMDYLVIRTAEKTTRVYLDEIAVLLIENTAVSLTAYLLAEMTERKIKVIFCDAKHNPSSELVPFYGSHDTSYKIRTQIKWEDSAKDTVWAEIVKAKLRGQMSVLPPEQEAARLLIESYIPGVMPGDSTNREGHAAKVYFNALYGKGFTRGEENPINAYLNYGYDLLMSAFSREIVACGYITPLGIKHSNVFNQFNLACDLMEPFRPYIDKRVFYMPHGELGKDQKLHIVDTLNEVVKIADQKHHLLSAIHIYCISVFNALAENDIECLRFPGYE